MKKYIAFLLCLIMLISLVSCGETKNNTDLTSNTENQNKDIQDSDYSNEKTPTSLEIYKPVLEVYRLAVDELKDLYSFVNVNPQGSASELFGLEPSTEKEWFLGIIDAIYFFYGGHGEEDKTSPHHKLSCGYAIKDLNGDGVDELVLLTDDYMVCAIFSITDGKPILLGNYRTRHSAWIDEKGWIHENGSGGADNSMNAVYKIADGGASMELIAEFGTNGHEWIGDTAYTKYYKLVNGEKVSITESEYFALNEQYTKYLGTHAGAEATKNYSSLTFISLYTEAEIAMEMYEAAINDKICVIDEHLGEIKLKACRFPSNNARIDECKLLTKAILDLDVDGINEYVIQSPDKDHIVLHYYGGKVFSYCFDKNNFYNLNADGSFYWSDSYESENWTHGLNQITFDGSSLSIKEIYRIKHITPFDFYENLEFYVDGKHIKREEFLDYHKSEILVIFSPLDISCEYPISSEKACEIASNYWGIESGMSEGATGTRILHKIVILEKPNSDTQGYRISWQWEGYRNHVPDPPYSLPPENVIIHKELFVDAITGECREYTNTERAMEMYKAFLRNEISTDGLYLKNFREEYLMNYLWERNGSVHYAYADMDGDGQVELLVSGIDTFVFSYSHESNEVTYISTHNFREMSSVYADGSYSWARGGGGDGVTYGVKKNGKDIWRIENDGGANPLYYIGDTAVTEEELLKYIEENPTPEEVKFTAISGEGWNKVIDEECAEEIASEYWNIKDGDINEQTGKEYRIYVSGMAEEKYYVRLHSGYYYEPDIDVIYVDAITGKILTDFLPDGKG